MEDTTQNKTLNFITEASVSGSCRLAEEAPSPLIITVKKNEGCRETSIAASSSMGIWGQIKIGYLGLATMIERNHRVHSMIGTPEFMGTRYYKILQESNLWERPKAMDKVRDPQIKGFIKKCLGFARPSASELLQDLFFEGLDDVKKKLRANIVANTKGD
ncbi:probable serine/threonine-protein kinase WNK11 [Prosopis cineraria]|uniref:probable serine/threonine-protein kinase WNK11 n=1 Tax=Prosopis cineraria TaxID=364024 RepID=UPI0024106B6A|nr:probable serine/threonine-protein kinase WNK11 [Prosopis cineraria]